MSEIKVNSIKGVGASAAAITVNNSDGTCTANITNNLSNRRLTINGDMKIAQRGTSSTSNGYKTVDRINLYQGNTGVTVTQSQQSLSSSDTPYTLGFRHFYRVALSAAATASANTEIAYYYNIEAQDLATSGWNYTSSSSNITLSFWFRCSTNQTFYCYLQSKDGTEQSYAFSFTASGNNAWTKITKTFIGDSNITINNDNGNGLTISFVPFFGTDLTNNKTLNTWSAFDAANRLPDMASTWLTAGASTFDLTGLQLEVGSVATDFEHRSFAQELELCKRYFQVVGESGKFSGHVAYYRNTSVEMQVAFFPEMRAIPTFTATSGSNYYYFYRQTTFDVFNAWTDLGSMGAKGGAVYSSESDVAVTDTGIAGAIYFNTGAQLFFNAEL